MGRRIATRGWDNTVKVWDANSGQSLLTINLEKSPAVSDIVYSPDGKRLAFTTAKHFQIVDAVNGETLLSLAPVEGAAIAVVFTPDGERIAAAARWGHIRIYDSHDGTLLLEFSANVPNHEQMVFSPDGQHLASAGDNGAMMWDAKPGDQLFPFRGMAKASASVAIAYSPRWQMGCHHG